MFAPPLEHESCLICLWIISAQHRATTKRTLNPGLFKEWRFKGFSSTILEGGKCPSQEYKKRTSLVAEWKRIHLPMQGTWVQSLVWEDSTHPGATETLCHNYGACALEPESGSYWAHVLQLLKTKCSEPVLHNKRSHCDEQPAPCNKE